MHVARYMEGFGPVAGILEDILFAAEHEQGKTAVFGVVGMEEAVGYIQGVQQEEVEGREEVEESHTESILDVGVVDK